MSTFASRDPQMCSVSQQFIVTLQSPCGARWHTVKSWKLVKLCYHHLS